MSFNSSISFMHVTCNEKIFDFLDHFRQLFNDWKYIIRDDIRKYTCAPISERKLILHSSSLPLTVWCYELMGVNNNGCQILLPAVRHFNWNCLIESIKLKSIEQINVYVKLINIWTVFDEASTWVSHSRRQLKERKIVSTWLKFMQGAISKRLQIKYWLTLANCTEKNFYEWREN